jgi:hypothetical protein
MQRRRRTGGSTPAVNLEEHRHLRQEKAAAVAAELARSKANDGGSAPAAPASHGTPCLAARPPPPHAQFCPTNAAFHEFAEMLGFQGNNPVAQLLSSASQDPAMLKNVSREGLWGRPRHA